MSRKTASTMYGNLDLLILHTLSDTGPGHGLGISDAIETCSDGSVRVETGALYRALHRLEEDGFLKADWRISETNRKAKFYALTPAGKEELRRVQDAWTRHTQAVSKILGIGWEVAP